MVTIADVERARLVLRGVAHHTHLLHSTSFSRMLGCQIFLKLENLQRTGSFKLRGAYYKIANLSETERAHGVLAASAGNHAQGVAVAAAHAGLRATIVMPETAPLAKVEATRSYGAEVVLHGATYDDAYQYARRVEQERGLTLIPAFDDPAIVAGQGTVGLEILEDLPEVDDVIVPVGGGGLIAGIAVALKELKPDARVIGVQAAGANAVVQSFRNGRLRPLPAVQTVADGIAVKRPGDLTFRLIRKYVDEMVAVDDEAIIRAIVLLMERSKQVVEGAGAVPLAALLAGAIAAEGRNVVLILSGGNIDMNQIARVIHHGLTAVGRYLIVCTRLKDQPGQLMRLLRLLAEQRANVLDIEHHRTGLRLPPDEVEVQLTVETRDAAHGAEIEELLRQAEYRLLRQDPETC